MTATAATSTAAPMPMGTHGSPSLPLFSCAWFFFESVSVAWGFFASPFASSASGEGDFEASREAKYLEKRGLLSAGPGSPSPSTRTCAGRTMP